MAQLAHFERTFLDSAGNPIVGATIALYPQGATIVSGGPTVFTVDDPGAFLAAKLGRVIRADGSVPDAILRTVATVGGVTATTITFDAPGFSGTSNNDRLVYQSSNPTVYKDAAGNESAGGLVTDANGYVSGWVQFAAYDVFSHQGTSPLGNAADHFWFDITPEPGNDVKCNDWMSGTTVLRKFNTLRALKDGDRFVQYASSGAIKWYVELDGSLVARIPAHHVAGALTVDNGGAAITGAITGSTTIAAGTTITAGTGITATAGNIQASAAAGYVKSSRYRGRQGTVHVVGDYTLDAGWGNAATLSIIGSDNRDSRGQIQITANGAGIAANPFVTLTFKDGAWDGANNPFAIGVPGTGNSVIAPATDVWYCAATTTQAAFQLAGTPTAGRAYNLVYWVIG